MNYQILNTVILLIGFILFILLQSLVINGIYECFQKDMIFYSIRVFLSEYLSKTLQKPIFGCIKCCASFYGFITYVPFVYFVFGFKWIEIPMFIADVFSLVYLNYQFYKKV